MRLWLRIADGNVTGCGKTPTAIGITGALNNALRISRVLVAAPLSIVGVWEEEFSKFADYDYTLAVLSGSGTKKAETLQSLNGDNLQIAVVNYESAWRLEKELSDWHPDLIIADEGHKLKSHNTNVSKAMHRLGALAKYRLLSDELPGLTASFEHIKIPVGGMTVFEMPGENPDSTETVKEFSAVILYHHPVHAYYKEKYTGGNNPPDCGSFDGITGEGDPGGFCDKCAYNRFGSGVNGSKACKNRRRIYLLREGEIFPMILSLPTGSLKDFTRYLTKLISKQRKSNSVVTRFTLRKAVNSGGIAYSQAQFTVDRVLTPDEYALIQKMSEQVKTFSENIGYDTEPEDAVPEIDPETGEVISPLA